ncbi:MAG TPA: PsbP-related protein, partial [Verrucomicrobiae bacterium]|nr:PsbP-related protein [Verrucomicrobiae bacterium]
MGSKRRPLIFLGLLLLVVVVGILVYEHGKNTNQNAPQASSTAASKPSVSVPPSWKQYTLKYEKLSFSYPDSWQLQDTSKSGQDTVTLTGTNGYTASLQSGNDARPSIDANPKILLAESEKLAGQAVYLDFLADQTGNVSQVYVSTSKSDASAAPSARHAGGLLIARSDYPASSPSESLLATTHDENYLNTMTVLNTMHY